MKIISHLFQIEDTLDSMFAFVTETKTALEQIINISSSTSDKNCPSYGEKRKKSNVGEALGRSLKNVCCLYKMYYFYIVSIKSKLKLCYLLFIYILKTLFP